MVANTWVRTLYKDLLFLTKYYSNLSLYVLIQLWDCICFSSLCCWSFQTNRTSIVFWMSPTISETQTVEGLRKRWIFPNITAKHAQEKTSKQKLKEATLSRYSYHFVRRACLYGGPISLSDRQIAETRQSCGWKSGFVEQMHPVRYNNAASPLHVAPGERSASWGTIQQHSVHECSHHCWLLINHAYYVPTNQLDRGRLPWPQSAS